MDLSYYSPARRATLLWILAVAALAGCAGGPPPVFEGYRAIGGQSLLLPPVVRVGAVPGQAAPEALQNLLALETRQSLARGGVALSPDDGAEDLSRLRDGLQEALVRQRREGRGGRLRPGTDLGLGDHLQSLISRGAASGVFLVLTRWGSGTDEKGFLPRPQGELMTPKELRPDFVIPQVPRESEGALVLDFLVFDAVTGKVVTHRRVAYPGEKGGTAQEAIPLLVREATRGISP